MRNRIGLATVVAAGIGVAGLLAMSPALAGAGPGPAAGQTQPGVAVSAPGGGGMSGGLGAGTGPGAGMGRNAGNGAGRGDGSCPGMASTAAKGTLTDGQEATLADMAQEEKLAHDLYVSFAARYDAVVFDRIARSETQHLTLVRGLLDRYGLADPTAGEAAGRFSDGAWQADYDRLLAQGSADEKAALGVGKAVEQADIEDLENALGGLTAPDVQQVYAHLLMASRHHLAAFENWSR